jgi:3-O-alpha-D-mannopyranosyl-alpha-D-mannopyranose xylosylphosphotransferase
MLLTIASSASRTGHRFGHRKRMGLQHIPKVFSRAALEESAQIWAADFAHSSRRRFREVERGPSEESRVGDLHATWMANELMVERSRESMLWTWACVIVLSEPSSERSIPD